MYDSFVKMKGSTPSEHKLYALLLAKALMGLVN